MEGLESWSWSELHQAESLVAGRPHGQLIAAVKQRGVRGPTPPLLVFSQPSSREEPTKQKRAPSRRERDGLSTTQFIVGEGLICCPSLWNGTPLYSDRVKP